MQAESVYNTHNLSCSDLIQEASMPEFLNLLFLLLLIWLLAGIVLILHRASPKVGRAPLLIFLGGLAVALQLNTFGMVYLKQGDWLVNLDSLLIFPVVMFGVLIIYVVDGTVRAQVASLGLILVTVSAALFRIFLSLFVSLPGVIVLQPGSEIYSIRVLLGSLTAVGLDLTVLIISYQALSNLRHRFPSRLAAGIALMLSLSVDAIIFPLIVHGVNGLDWKNMLLHWIGKMVAGLALWPGLTFYFGKTALILPESSATAHRPILDLFTSTLQFESRARYHYSLLHTLTEINKIIVRSSDPRSMLQQACELLVGSREYRLAWVGQIDESQQAMIPLAVAGGIDWDKAEIQQHIHESFHCPAAQLGKPVFATRPDEGGERWQALAALVGCNAAAVLPIKQGSLLWGVLGVCTAPGKPLDQFERELLHDLADDLAHALLSLEARQQQAILITAAETMRDGFVIADLSGKILYVNSIVAQIVGKPKEAIVGGTLADLLTPTQAIEFPRLFKVLLKQGLLAVEFDYQSPDGRSLFLSINATLVRNERGEPAQIVATLRDTSQQHRYEYQLLTLSQLTTELVQIHDNQLLMDRILQISENLLSAQASGIYFVNPENLTIRNVLTHNLPEEYSQRIAKNYHGLPGETASHTFRPVYVNDTLANDLYGERIQFMAAFDIRALLILPIIYQDLPIGALTVYYQQPHQFPASELQLGTTLAQTLAIVIQNARLYQAESSQRDLAEALASAARTLNSSLDTEAVFDNILEQVMRVVPCRAANLMMVENGYCVMIRGQGYEMQREGLTHLIGQRIPIVFPNLISIIATGQPRLITDTAQAKDWQYVPEMAWVRSYAAVPLMINQQIVGVLNVDGDSPGQFDQETISHLLDFSAHAATAIHNARLYAESLRRAEEMAALVAAATTVSSSLDLKQVLDIVAEKMTKTLRVDGCAISDYDPRLNAVTLFTHYGYSNDKDNPIWLEPYFLEEYPITRQVLETNTPIQLHFGDPGLDAGERQFMQQAQIETLLMLPLVIHDRTIGLVELMARNADRIFNEDEIVLGLTLASHAASAIQNANLYKQLREHALELEERVWRRTSELNQAKEHIEAILASVPDAVFVLDENLAMIQANDAGAALLQQAHEENLELFSSQFINALLTHSPQSKAILQVSERSYQAVASPLPPRDNQLQGQVIVFRDVTHFRELDRMKTQFVTDVSHELRTPLTNLSLYLELLSVVKDPQRQKEYIAILRRETDRLTYLIEDLLTISRLEADKVALQIRAIDLNLLVLDLVQDRFALASQQGVNLMCRPQENLPPAMADPSLLTQALSNLLTNAINYTPAGGKVMLFTAIQHSDNRCWLTVSVNDTGVGIETQELQRVFERFYRGSASQITGAEGTGLGLAISQEIVNRLGGHITLKSTPGTGSTFTIWLKPADDDSML